MTLPWCPGPGAFMNIGLTIIQHSWVHRSLAQFGVHHQVKILFHVPYFILVIPCKLSNWSEIISRHLSALRRSFSLSTHRLVKVSWWWLWLVITKLRLWLDNTVDGLLYAFQQASKQQIQGTLTLYSKTYALKPDGFQIFFCHTLNKQFEEAWSPKCSGFVWIFTLSIPKESSNKFINIYTLFLHSILLMLYIPTLSLSPSIVETNPLRTEVEIRFYRLWAERRSDKIRRHLSIEPMGSTCRRRATQWLDTGHFDLYFVDIRCRWLYAI